MAKQWKTLIKSLAATSACLGMLACGSSNNNSGNNGNTTTDSDIQASTVQIQATTQLAVQNAIVTSGLSLKLESVDESPPCATGGTSHVTGDVSAGSPNSFNLDVDLTGCTGLTGAVNATGTFAFDGAGYSTDYTITKQGGDNQCDLTFNNLEISINIPDFTVPTTNDTTITGGVDGDCTTGSASCIYHDLMISQGPNGGSQSGSIDCE